MNLIKYAAPVVLTAFGISGALAQTPPPAPQSKLKDELRMPWTRGDESFIRRWLVVGPFAGDLATDPLASPGGEASAQPQDGLEVKRADGTSAKWHDILDANKSVVSDENKLQPGMKLVIPG